MTQRAIVALMFLAIVTAGCGDLYQPTVRPDYAIRVVPTAKGDVALPPPCPSWTTENADPYDNQPIPQFGCASARNLAAMVEQPQDLLQGRSLADSRGVTAVGAVRRYDNNQSRGLIQTGVENNQAAVTTAPTASSALTGDITNGGASGSSAAASPTSSP